MHPADSLRGIKQLDSEVFLPPSINVEDQEMRRCEWIEHRVNISGGHYGAFWCIHEKIYKLDDSTVIYTISRDQWQLNCIQTFGSAVLLVL